VEDSSTFAVSVFLNLKSKNGSLLDKTEVLRINLKLGAAVARSRQGCCFSESQVNFTFELLKESRAAKVKDTD
jgi:hypothetical protein